MTQRDVKLTEAKIKWLKLSARKCGLSRCAVREVGSGAPLPQSVGRRWACELRKVQRLLTRLRNVLDHPSRSSSPRGVEDDA